MLPALQHRLLASMEHNHSMNHLLAHNLNSSGRGTTRSRPAYLSPIPAAALLAARQAV